ncbi:carbamate kinase [Phyllobacterium trifolii]|uniref:Carbamate kinase n=2 Tax=Phyllobacterium trifolii TaxID=300193 RepID=A0A839UEJ3_9HYPH|nr:carbamate kinase [Phyllobacterium trifolii]
MKRGEPMTAANQRANIRGAALALADIIAEGHMLVITHGNGPQVGLLALQAAAAPEEGQFPLDVLDAESAGMIGYVIEQELGNILKDRQFATLLTQVTVDCNDPAFFTPTKPIGPMYDEAAARALVATRHWRIAADGSGWRRVVPSPKPLIILGTDVIRILVEHNVIVICTGGGGIPVVKKPDGSLVGVDAVIDKDLASALLARQLHADALLMLTDVDAVYADYGTAHARKLETIHPMSVRAADFASGSMGPKIAAAAEFAHTTGKSAYIGSLEDAVAILQGVEGTRIGVGANSKP